MERVLTMETGGEAILSLAGLLAILSDPFIALAAIKVHDIARKEGWL